MIDTIAPQCQMANGIIKYKTPALPDEQIHRLLYLLWPKRDAGLFLRRLKSAVIQNCFCQRVLVELLSYIWRSPVEFCFKSLVGFIGGALLVGCSRKLARRVP